MEKKDLVIGKKYLHKSKIEVYYLGEGNNKYSVVQPTNGVDGVLSLKDSHPKIKDIIGNDRFWAYENIHLELIEIEPNLNLNELIVGEVYVSEVYNHPEWRSLLKCISNTNKAYSYKYRLYTSNDYSYKYRLYTSNDYHRDRLDLREHGFTDTNSHYKASKEESKWLNVCIKANKFIPKEDLDLYDDATFELKDLKERTKNIASLNDLITRAVILDNPNLIAEELGCTIQDIIDSKNDETYSCKKNQFDKLNSADCAGLRCYNNKCPFRSNSTITEEWLLSKVNENKFEVGAWYYCKSTHEWYFKYVKEDSAKVEFYDHIDIDLKKFKRNNFLCHLPKKGIRDIRKADLSEIQEYLPEGHIDKAIEEPKVKNEGIIPVYVECINPSLWENTIRENNGNLIFNTKEFKFEYYDGNWELAYSTEDFKPSTKEAFDAQNQPKSIGKWSVGSYFVIEKDKLYGINSSKRGDICLIKKEGIFNFVNKKDIYNWSFDSREGSKWFATLQEAEEFSKTLLNKKNMFKKDDYIVIIKSQYLNDVSFPINYCYKQRCNKDYLSVYLDAQEIENGWGILKFDAHKDYFNWRYATKEEVAEYDRLGKPFDVTTLNKKEELEVDSLSKWEDEVKKLNLDVYELANYINDLRIPTPIYYELPEFLSEEKTHLLISKDECNSKLDLSLRDEKEINVKEIKSNNNNNNKLNLSLNN